MGVDKIIAINEKEIDRLILDINDYAIKMKRLFNEIESVVDETASYYECSIATKYRNNFNVFKQNFPTMVNNLLTYKTDMHNLKFKFSKQEGVLSDVLIDEAKKALSKNIK